jgi:hypothetical protein
MAGAVLEPVIARYRGIVKRLYFRGDAAFANPEIYEFLEAECMGYAIRLPANRVLQDKIGYLLKRPVGPPPHGCVDSNATSSSAERRATRRFGCKRSGCDRISLRSRLDKTENHAR